MGGTFDPVHNGHLITAQAVKELRNLEKIIFIPSYIAPHKLNFKSAPGLHRLEMIKLATSSADYFEYSDFELKSNSVSYTINTLNYFKNLYDKIDLIIGYDNLLEFSAWKNPDEILKIVSLVVLKRKVEEIPEIKDRFYQSAVFLETPIIEISGSEIRKRVKNDLPINFLVPDKVKEYIYHFNLYKD
jgi:nicotinate-nucleotide adenylyltransferase